MKLKSYKEKLTAAVIGQAIASMDRMWWAFILNSVWAFVLLASAVLLVPHYGALGLAVAFLASYSVHALTSTYVQVHFRNGPIRPESSVCNSFLALDPENDRARDARLVESHRSERAGDIG